ncbi:unnamed protein product, partial [Heterotrigona itama]
KISNDLNDNKRQKWLATERVNARNRVGRRNGQALRMNCFFLRKKNKRTGGQTTVTR